MCVIIHVFPAFRNCQSHQNKEGKHKQNLFVRILSILIFHSLAMTGKKLCNWLGIHTHTAWPFNKRMLWIYPWKTSQNNCEFIIMYGKVADFCWHNTQFLLFHSFLRNVFGVTDQFSVDISLLQVWTWVVTLYPLQSNLVYHTIAIWLFLSQLCIQSLRSYPKTS